MYSKNRRILRKNTYICVCILALGIELSQQSQVYGQHFSYLRALLRFQVLKQEND